MASQFYEEYVNSLLGAPTHSAIDLNGDTIKVMLRDEGTTALNIATQVDYADISAAAVGTDQTIGSVTIGSADGAGSFDHANLTWSSVSGASVESLDYYKDSGTPGTSPLICNLDSWTGLPVTPNGGDITGTPAGTGVFKIPTS